MRDLKEEKELKEAHEIVSGYLSFVIVHVAPESEREEEEER